MMLAVLYDKCTKCDLCERACPQNAVTQVDGYPIICLHCSPESAPCLLSCPVGAIKHHNGAIQIMEDECVGCRLCFYSCPIAAIRIDERGKAFKCDLCMGEDKPLCIKACPVNAIKLADKLEEFVQEKRGHFLDIIAKMQRFEATL